MGTIDIKAIGKRIHKIRGKATLIEFATHFEMHPNTISRYEKGQNAPDANFLDRLCTDFNIEPAWLLLGQGPMRPGDQTTAPPEHLPPCETYLPPPPAKRDSALENIQVPAEEFKISEMMTKTVEVLESNTIYRTALASNINAFHHSINMIVQIDRLEGTVAKMETDAQETKGRMSSMEKQMNALLEKINDLEATQEQSCSNQQEVVNGH